MHAAADDTVYVTASRRSTVAAHNFTQRRPPVDYFVLLVDEVDILHKNELSKMGAQLAGEVALIQVGAGRFCIECIGDGAWQ